MKKLFKLIIIIFLLALLINLYVILSTKKNIVNIDNIKEDNYDCIVVLGASIKNNRPSKMLEERLKMAIELYENKISSKILVSGDHIDDDYDEVSVMKNYLIENGIPSEDIFMDHLGISTYDSILRTKLIYKANKVLIVTQKYHLYRALYIANDINLKAYGVDASERVYVGQLKRDIREILARIKDFIKCLFKFNPIHLGEVISIKGNGDKTND